MWLSDANIASISPRSWLLSAPSIHLAILLQMIDEGQDSSSSASKPQCAAVRFLQFAANTSILSSRPCCRTVTHAQDPGRQGELRITQANGGAGVRHHQIGDGISPVLVARPGKGRARMDVGVPGVEFETYGRIAPKFRPKRVKQARKDENRVEDSEICLFFVQSLAGATVCCSGNFKSDRLLAACRT